MKPSISIIVPVHNVEPYIHDCIDSILAQEFQNFEVILVNDGSTDKSGEICDELARKDDRVKIVHKEYGGVSSARNIGIKMAQGDFIGFVDGDDRIDRNMYKELFRLCTETNSDIAICKLGREIDGKITNIEKDIFIKEMYNTEAMQQLFKGNLYRFSLCNKLYNKNCFDNIYFPEGRIHEDLSTTYKLFANCKKATFTNYCGYIYIKRENSILTSSYSEKRLDAFVGWDEILTFMKDKYSNIYSETLTCFVYWTIDNVIYILNQVHDTKERNLYLGQLQKIIRKKYKEINEVNSLPLFYKYLITILFFNFRLIIFSHYIKTFWEKRDNNQKRK